MKKPTKKEWASLQRSNVILDEFNPRKPLTMQHGNYVNIPHLWLQIVLNANDAVLLAYLSNCRDMFKKSEKLSEGGWMYQTRETIRKRIGFKKDAQAASLKRLELCEFIELKFAPPPSGARFVRWVRLNRKEIHKCVAHVANDGSLEKALAWLKKAQKKDVNKIKGKFGKKMMKARYSSPKRKAKRKLKLKRQRERLEEVA